MFLFAIAHFILVEYPVIQTNTQADIINVKVTKRFECIIELCYMRARGITRLQKSIDLFADAKCQFGSHMHHICGIIIVFQEWLQNSIIGDHILPIPYSDWQYSYASLFIAKEQEIKE